MKKLLLLSCGLLFIPSILYAGTMSLTTYYPAPNGNYSNIQTANETVTTVLNVTGTFCLGTSCPGTGAITLNGATGAIGATSIDATGNVYAGWNGTTGAAELASSGAISGGSLGVGSGAISGGSLTVYGNGGSGIISAGSLNINSGGITNAGSISGATSLDGITVASNTLTFGTGASQIQIGSGNITFGTGAGAVTLSNSSGLNVNACITSTGTCPSDVRLKNNIVPLTDALSKIDQLKGVSFTWNHLGATMGYKEGQKSIGLIAQDMQKVYPELVGSFKSGKAEYLNIDYPKFTAVLLESVKELKGEVDTLQSQVNALQEKVKVLEKQK